MKVVEGWPPEERLVYLEQFFPNIRKAKLYITIGDTCYNASGEVLTKSTQVHEQYHSDRQLEYPGGLDAYIHRYCTDQDFREEQEMKAFALQVLFIEKTQGHSAMLNKILEVSKSLAGTTYDLDITQPVAARRLYEHVAVLRRSTAE